MPNMDPKEYSGFVNIAHASSANGQPIHMIIGTPEKAKLYQNTQSIHYQIFKQPSYAFGARCLIKSSGNGWKYFQRLHQASLPLQFTVNLQVPFVHALPH